MKPVWRFALGPPQDWGPLWNHRSHLLMDGDSVGVICGDELRHQFQCDTGFLVITSYDYFDGTSHWFYLLDRNGSVLDRAATPDYFGYIEGLEIAGPSSINFGFFGTNDRWSLTVHERSWASTLVGRMSCFVLGRRGIVLRGTRGAPWSLRDDERAARSRVSGRFIPNGDLRLDHLPDAEDQGAVFAFAMTFDAYEHFGSLAEATQSSFSGSRATLTDIRNELFILARRWQHDGDDCLLPGYRDLLPKFRELLTATGGA